MARTNCCDGLQVAVLHPLGEVDFLVVGQQRGFGNFAQVEPHRIVDEVGIEALKNIEIAFEIGFRLDLVGHLGRDFLRESRPCHRHDMLS